MKIAMLLPIDIRELKEYFPKQELPLCDRSTLFISLIKYYVRLGHEVLVCTINRKSLISKIYYGNGITVFIAGSLPRPKISALFNFEYEIRQMASFLKKNLCDIYHAHWLYEYAQAAIRVNQKNAIITVHDWPDEIHKYLSDFHWDRRFRLGNESLKQGLHFTAVSPYIDGLIKKAYLNKDVEVIPNFFKFNLNKKKIQSKTLNTNSAIIIAVNNGFGEIKNTKNLLRAFQLIKNIKSNSKLIMLGSDYEVNGKAAQWAYENECAEGVMFAGVVSHERVMHEMLYADVLLHTSREESYGMIFLEAMICKTAVVAGERSGAAPWVLDYGKSGILVDVENPSAIANAVLELLNSKELWECKTQNGLKRSELFSLDNIGKQYLSYYERIKTGEQDE